MYLPQSTIHYHWTPIYLKLSFHYCLRCFDFLLDKLGKKINLDQSVFYCIPTCKDLLVPAGKVTTGGLNITVPSMERNIYYGKQVDIDIAAKEVLSRLVSPFWLVLFFKKVGTGLRGSRR